MTGGIRRPAPAAQTRARAAEKPADFAGVFEEPDGEPDDVRDDEPPADFADRDDFTDPDALVSDDDAAASDDDGGPPPEEAEPTATDRDSGE